MFSLLLNKPLCYSALLSLSLHQSQLTVFNTYHSPSAHFPYFLFFWCSEWIQHSAQLPFQPVPWLSLPPASPGDSVPASHRALGQVPAWQFLCPHTPVPPQLAVKRGARAHTACRRAGLGWDHPLLLAEAPGTPAALPALLSPAKSTGQTSLVWENKHHQSKAHNANVLHKAVCDTFTSKYDLV